MLIFPNAKKFEICCGIEAFGVPLWRKLLLQTFIQKSVYSEIHKAHLKIMLFPADEQPPTYV